MAGVCAGQGSLPNSFSCLPNSFSPPPPIYLQPRHSRGAWWSGNTWGTLRERRHNQTRKKALPHCWGAVRRGWASRGRWRTRGETEETSDTPAGPAARSCPSKVPEHPGWEWGVAKEGERLQATSTPSAGLRGEAAGGAQSPVGPLRVGLGRSGASPGPGEALSTTHRHAREDGVSPRGTGALPGLTLERQGAFVRGGPGWRASWKLPSGRWHRLSGWRGQGFNLESVS